MTPYTYYEIQKREEKKESLPNRYSAL